ncbi:MAG: tyrosine-type recombinase/integrase [Allosphingosinicella sp.]|uniref:tyrosine-type recombinase/integrase n=1 Tax=Allosphingosinicella sp. TaxID=2823234 RepID=UPI00395AB2A8
MLTDMKARQAKPREADYKLGDSGGLYLLVTKGGAKSWRLKYRFAGKEKRLTFGRYPEVSLAEARARRDEAKRLLRDMRDPAVEAMKRRLVAAAAAEATFEKVAREWHELQSPRWAPVHAADVIRSLQNEVFSNLGSVPLREIDAPLVLAVLRKIERRGALETAKRVRQRMSAVFVHGISTGICTADPASTVARALKPAPKKTRQPAMTNVEALRGVLRATEESGASPVTKLASRLLALTAVRPGVVRGFEWSEIEGVDWSSDHPEDTEAGLWRVPSSRMKLVLERKDDATFDHLVPLSRQAIEAIAAIRPLTKRLPILFPSNRHLHRPLSENAIGYLYNRCGYHGRHVPHGWRAAFSTIMNERAERAGRSGDRAVIDLMLAHVPSNKVEGAYNRAAYMERRREIAQEWADLLTEGLCPAADLLKGPRR